MAKKLIFERETIQIDEIILMIQHFIDSNKHF